jgi:hypothetical protein
MGQFSKLNLASGLIYKRSFLFIFSILQLTALLSCTPFNNTKHMPTLQLSNQSSAVERAIALTGLNIVSGQVSAQLATINDTNTPFLAAQLKNRAGWCVEFDAASFTGKLKSSQAGYRDPFEAQRKFVVSIDSKTGQLLSIKSQFKGEDGGLEPEPDTKTAESQLKAGGEVYSGFPTVDPKITFLEAVDAVLAQGIGSPFVAKEVNGLYVMDSRVGSPPRPVWIITLRGLPPRPSHWSKENANTQVQSTTMRNVVDAKTGKCLFATNFPRSD